MANVPTGLRQLDFNDNLTPFVVLNVNADVDVNIYLSDKLHNE